MGFSYFKSEKGYAKINDEKVDLEHSDYPENPQSDVLEVQDEPGCKTGTETSTEQPKKYKFKDQTVYFATLLWSIVAMSSTWLTLWAVDDGNAARKEILAQLKLQLEEDGKREGTIRIIHTAWSDYLNSAQWSLASPVGLIVLSIFFCGMWLFRREFSDQRRAPTTRAAEAMFLLLSVYYGLISYFARSQTLHAIEKDIVTFISKGEW